MIKVRPGAPGVPGGVAAPKSADAPRKVETLADGRPPIIDVLGDAGVHKLTGVHREGGRIAWLNWSLAAELGLELPRDRKMTPELEEKLLRALSIEVLPKGEEAGDRKTVELYSDYYGGEGLGYNRGSGRAAFFGDLNLNAKGIGAIEEMLDPRTSYDHRHGAMSLVEGGLESVLGEVNTNLFSRGSTRILAVLDRGDYIVWESGGAERRGVAFRTGKQTRPAHLLAGRAAAPPYEQLLRMMEVSGDLVKNAKGQVDLSASLTRLVDAHARTSAEQFRHRILHGALSPSNTEHDGAMLDLATETSQPHTAGVRVLDRGGDRDALYSFETERARRVQHLERFYRIAEDALAKSPKARAGAVFKPFSVKATFEAAYAREKTRMLVSATGLPPVIGDELAKASPALVARFASAAAKLAAFENPGKELNVDKQVVTDASVADVFGALGRLPREYFLRPDEPLEPRVRAALDLKLETPAKAAAVDREITELAESWRALMTAAKDLYHRTGGADDFALERAIIQRAEFENAPTPSLYRANLRWSMIEAVQAYEQSGDPHDFQQRIDSLITHSLRSADALKQTGETRALEDGTRIVQQRTVRGVTYGVALPKDGDPRVDVSVPVERLPDGRFRLPSLDGAVLDAGQLASMALRYTTDEWATHAEVPAKLDGDQLTFPIPSFSSQIARLEGVFHVTQGDFWIKDRASNFEGYVFAVPDPWER
ncbi:hypothetical protein L6R52_37060 [Myxococcota bacterium]|nr:hypothetical protein [Myxococcota bacterium]